MTPAQEKAKELVYKFRPLVTTWDCYWDVPRGEYEVIKDAKQCAIICVEEIIKYAKRWGDMADQDIKEFQEVITEINKL